MLIPNIFHKYNIKPIGIIHIGAHTCEEREIYHAAGVGDERILWIEANPMIVESVQNVMDKTVKIIQGCISDKEGEVSFMITNNMQSSSLLPFGTHSKEHPDVVPVDYITLRTTTLPCLLDLNQISPHSYDFLCMDIQGAELLALKGMVSILGCFKGIYLEVNTDELYRGCGLLDEVKMLLGEYGFSMVDILMTPHKWGDALFLRTP